MNRAGGLAWLRYRLDMAGVEGSNPFRPITHLYLFIHIILTLRSDREIWFFTGQHNGCIADERDIV